MFFVALISIRNCILLTRQNTAIPLLYQGVIRQTRYVLPYHYYPGTIGKYTLPHYCYCQDYCAPYRDIPTEIRGEGSYLKVKSVAVPRIFCMEKSILQWSKCEIGVVKHHLLPLHLFTCVLLQKIFYR